jgi:hypothetical protein
MEPFAVGELHPGPLERPPARSHSGVELPRRGDVIGQQRASVAQAGRDDGDAVRCPAVSSSRTNPTMLATSPLRSAASARSPTV